jgi:hypothetical protein
MKTTQLQPGSRADVLGGEMNRNEFLEYQIFKKKLYSYTLAKMLSCRILTSPLIGCGFDMTAERDTAILDFSWIENSTTS